MFYLSFLFVGVFTLGVYSIGSVDKYLCIFYNNYIDPLFLKYYHKQEEKAFELKELTVESVTSLDGTKLNTKFNDYFQSWLKYIYILSDTKLYVELDPSDIEDFQSCIACDIDHVIINYGYNNSNYKVIVPIPGTGHKASDNLESTPRIDIKKFKLHRKIISATMYETDKPHKDKDVTIILKEFLGPNSDFHSFMDMGCTTNLLLMISSSDPSEMLKSLKILDTFGEIHIVEDIKLYKHMKWNNNIN